MQCEFCDREVFVKARQLCRKHYYQFITHGQVYKKSRYGANEIVNRGCYSEIILYDKNGKEAERARINNKHIEKIKERRWSRTGIYATCKINGKNVLMHHFILPPKKGYVIDHIDHNGLNNVDSNLRYLTHYQNIRHRKNKAVGYYWFPEIKKFVAEIKWNGKKYSLGCFINENDASLARSVAERILSKIEPR